MPDYGAAALFFEQHAVMHVMRKNKAAIASEIDIDDLNVGLAPGQIILPGETTANLSIADIVMDRLDAERRLCAVVRDVEQPEPADHRRAEMLQDEACIAVILPGRTSHAKAVSRPGYIGKPLPILLGRLFADAAD